MAIATYNAVSGQLPVIWQVALMYAQESFFMDSITAIHTDYDDMRPRGFSEYPSSGTVLNGLAETVDFPSQSFDYAALGTITPKEVGYRIDITDRRVATDASQALSTPEDVAQEFAYKVLRQPELDMINNFSSFTGGTVWAGTAASTAGTLVWGNLYAARAILDKAKIPGPYFAVVDSVAYMRLAAAANIAAVTAAAPLAIRNEIQSAYFVQQIDTDFFLFKTPNCSTNTVAQYFGGVFARDAIHYDLRRGFRIEPQRDASARLTELNATIWYGQGLVRPTRGVAIRGTVETAPNN